MGKITFKKYVPSSLFGGITSFAGSILMIFFSILTCTIGSQGGPNKMAAANFFGVIFYAIDLFSLYILFSHFRPRDALMGIFLLFFHELCVNLHVHKTTFERNYSLE